MPRGVACGGDVEASISPINVPHRTRRIVKCEGNCIINSYFKIPTIYYLLLIHSTIHLIIFLHVILDKAIIIIVYYM